jgi:benzoyl-CoA reductase/2-hydroxyglutaryl-CoA dehydratase subunit BcrC/BadD/HgdB
MEALKTFQDIATALPNVEIDRWKSRGGRVIGTVCSDIPEEVIHAAGMLPLRVRAPKLADTSLGDAHLHVFNCSYTRSILEALLRGELGFLDGFVTTNSCDHMLRLAGELKDKANMLLVHYFSMVHTANDATRAWFASEVQGLVAAMEKSLGTTITQEDLRSSIQVYNETRSLLARLDELRKNDPPPLSGAEHMRIVLAGMSMPRERFNEKLGSLLPELEDRRSGEPGIPRLMVVGGACDVPEFIQFIEERGAHIVADGLCFGMRHYRGWIDEGGEDPLGAIVERYTNREPCPAVINGFDASFEVLKEVVHEWKIDGIVCARLKFCDHWAGRRKMLVDRMRNEGVPLLDLEREYSTVGSGQIGTRVQAFLEMLSPT